MRSKAWQLWSACAGGMPNSASRSQCQRTERHGQNPCQAACPKSRDWVAAAPIRELRAWAAGLSQPTERIVSCARALSCEEPSLAAGADLGAWARGPPDRCAGVVRRDERLRQGDAHKRARLPPPPGSWLLAVARVLLHGHLGSSNCDVGAGCQCCRRVCSRSVARRRTPSEKKRDMA